MYRWRGNGEGEKVVMGKGGEKGPSEVYGEDIVMEMVKEERTKDARGDK